MGYHRAGFDEIVGVDIKPQPRYPFQFVQADALEFCKSFGAGFDAIHASPPCQDHMLTPLPNAKKHGTGWLLSATRAALKDIGRPSVIENVPGAPLRPDYRLCGCMFDLRTDEWELRRLRFFEVSPHLGFSLQPPHDHQKPAVSVVGNGQPSWHRRKWKLTPEGKPDYQAFRELCSTLMGIDWMRRDEMSQAIPPAYTEFIGKQLLEALTY